MSLIGKSRQKKNVVKQKSKLLDLEHMLSNVAFFCDVSFYDVKEVYDTLVETFPDVEPTEERLKAWILNYKQYDSVDAFVRDY